MNVKHSKLILMATLALVVTHIDLTQLLKNIDKDSRDKETQVIPAT